MRRIHTTFDLIEAHILVGLLRSRELNVWLFDADFVRLDWFKAIAFGGYRIMADDNDEVSARNVLHDYAQAKADLSDAPDAGCPSCDGDAIHDDPQPRRNVFTAWLVFSIVAVLLALTLHPTSLDLFFAIFMQLVFAIAAPWIIVRYFKWRYRCDTCGHHWRETRHIPYATLAKAHAGAFGPPG